MFYYVAPHQPEHLFSRKSKSERDARYIAEELACLVNDKSLGLKMPNGFSTKQLVEIKEETLMPKNKEEISTAVETLAKLSDSALLKRSMNQPGTGTSQTLR